MTLYVLLAVGGITSFNAPAFGQEEAVSPGKPKVPEISDEPKVVDTAQFIHANLTQKATVEFDKAPLSEVRDWLIQATGMPVVFDENELKNEGRALYDEYTDQLQDAPIYFLLDRLREQYALAWYIEDEILYITTELAFDHIRTLKTYPIGDLLDDDYDATDLVDTIMETTTGPWQEIDQDGGTIAQLGDVLFVSQTPQVQREVAALLHGLRQHGRQTLLLEPGQHLALLESFSQNISVDYQDIPLYRVVEIISREAEVPIRFNVAELKFDGRDPRDRTSISIRERPLEVVLKILLKPLSLEVILENGGLLITTELDAESRLQTAIYDVSDLCQNMSESSALIGAVQEQTGVLWREVDQDGGTIMNPRHDVLVVRHHEQGLSKVLQLLETYRNVLRISKPRAVDDPDDEILTHYYRIDSELADVLANTLWELIPEGRIDQAAQEEGEQKLGVISQLPSQPELLGTLLRPQTVLIITHRKGIHFKIEHLISRIKSGDSRIGIPSTPVKMRGYGGGGFGGGFFSVPERK